MRIKGFNFRGMVRHFLLPSIVFLLFSLNAYAQNNSAVATLDKANIPIGEQTVLHITVHVPANISVVFPKLADSIGKIKIVGAPKTDSLTDTKNASSKIITQSFTLTAFDPGTYIIPPFEFHTNTGYFRTNAITLKVNAVLVDTTKAFYDIKQPFLVNYTFWDWLRDHWIWVLLSALLLIVLAMAAFYLNSRLKHPLIIKAPPVLTAAQLAFKKLNELRDKKLWQQGKVKAYYIELTDIIRDYLESIYKIQAHEQTSDEIFVSLHQQQLPQGAIDILKKILPLADLVKFAKLEPTSTVNEQCLDDAIQLIALLAEPIHNEKSQEDQTA